MNYTLDETFELSAYCAILKIDEDISNMFLSDDFEIGIRDITTNDVKVINNTNIQKYGLTYNSIDFDEQQEMSLLNNGGLLIYLIDNNTLYFKQTIPYTLNNKVYGFNSSVISIWWNSSKDETIPLNIEFTSKLLPKIIRDHKIVQESTHIEDPVLSSINIRPEFDFDKKFPEYTYGEKIDNNYELGNTSALIVNSNNTVPVYVSTLSAIVGTDKKFIESDNFTVSSYMYDPTNTDNIYPISYIEDGPFDTSIELFNNIYTNIKYYTYKQFISADSPNYYSTKLMFTLS